MKFKKLILFGLFAILASKPVASKAIDFSIPAQSFLGVGALTDFFKDHYLFTPYALVGLIAYLGHKNRNNTLADRKHKLLSSLRDELLVPGLRYDQQEMASLALWCCNNYFVPNLAVRRLVNEFYETKSQTVNRIQQPARPLIEIFNEIQLKLFGHN